MNADLEDLDEDAIEAEYEADMLRAVQALDSRWNATGYKGHNTHDGVAYVFTLRWGRMAVASVEDSGVGGGPLVLFSPSARIHAHADDHGPLVLARDEWAAEAERLFPDESPYMRQESLVEAVLRKAGK